MESEPTAHNSFSIAILSESGATYSSFFIDSDVSIIMAARSLSLPVNKIGNSDGTKRKAWELAHIARPTD